MNAKKMTLEYSADGLKRSWGWLLGLGIVFILLGLIGLGMVVGLTLVSVLFFGVLLVVAGLAQFIDLLQCKGWRGRFWHALIAALYVIGGMVIFYDPLLATVLITAMLAWVLIIIGIVRMMMAFQLRGTKGYLWIFFAGLASLVLGILILIQWPFSALWLIGLFVAMEFMISGWTFIMMAFAARSTQ